MFLSKTNLLGEEHSEPPYVSKGIPLHAKLAYRKDRVAGEIGPPATRCGLADSRSRQSAKPEAGDRHGVCQRVFGPETDRLRRTHASHVAADRSEPGVDRDTHDRGTDGTDGATDGSVRQIQGLDLVQEGSVLVGRAAALEIARHFPPGGNLLWGDGLLDFGCRPGLEVVGLLLGELRFLAGFASEERASRRARSEERGQKESAEGERARHFRGYSYRSLWDRESLVLIVVAGDKIKNFRKNEWELFLGCLLCWFRLNPLEKDDSGVLFSFGRFSRCDEKDGYED